MPGEAEEYAEEEDNDTISVLSEEDNNRCWTMPGRAEQYTAPGKADQYAVPGRAERQYAVEPMRRVAPLVGPTWEQQVQTARQNLATSQLVVQQQQLWDVQPGVLMDTSAGRTHKSNKAEVCFHCQLPGHIHSQCANRRVPCTCVSKIQSLWLLASQVRARQSCGHDLRKGDNVTDPSVTMPRRSIPGLQDLQKRAWKIVAKKNAKKAEENTWISRMVVAESLGDLEGLIKSCAA